MDHQPRPSGPNGISGSETWEKIRHYLALAYVLLIVGLPLTPLVLAFTPRTISQFEAAPAQVAVLVSLVEGTPGMALGALAAASVVVGFFARDYFLVLWSAILAVEIPVLRWLLGLGALDWILKYA